MSKILKGFLFLVALQFAINAQGGYKDLILEGDKFLNKRPADVMNARMKYLEALNKETKDPNVYVKIAITFIYGKDARSANYYLDEGLKLFKDEKSNMKAILTYYKGMVNEFIPLDTKDTNKIKKHYKEAIDYYLASIDFLEVPSYNYNNIEFSKINVYCDAGRLYMLTNDGENGQKYFKLCLAEIGNATENKYYSIAHFGLAQIFRYLALADSSIFHYNKVLEIDPNNINTLSELYGVYFDLADYDNGFVIINKIDSIMSNSYNSLIKRANAPKDSLNYVSNILYNTKMEKGHLKFNSKDYAKTLKYYIEAYKYKKNRKLIELIRKMSILSDMSNKGWLPCVKDAKFITNGNEYFFYSATELKRNQDSSLTSLIKSIVTADVDLNMSNVFQSEYDATAPDNIEKVINSKYGSNEYSWSFMCGKSDFTQNFVKKFNPNGKETTKANDLKPVRKSASADSFELDILKFLCRAAEKSN